ncbi:MAG: rubredoxin [Oscillospiraceae bacterium]
MKKYVCTICGFVYDEAVGMPDGNLAPGTKWADIPDSWVCPICGAPKSAFEEQEVKDKEPEKPVVAQASPIAHVGAEEFKELSVGQLAALCSNLAKGCEKQYLAKEAALFTELYDYFKLRTPQEEDASTASLLALVEKDLKEGFVAANSAAHSAGDRGALRALTWSEKVTRILNSLLSKYEKEGEAFIANTNVYVCEICGFIYVGDEAPEICPVCKVPSWKIIKIERR